MAEKTHATRLRRYNIFCNIIMQRLASEEGHTSEEAEAPPPSPPHPPFLKAPAGLPEFMLKQVRM